MTDEQINGAIAPIHGWDLDPEEAHEWESRGSWVKSPRGQMKGRYEIPNYCNDLNAMREAEMTLPVHGGNGHEWDNSRSEFRWHLGLICLQPIHATARQRAEAFLKTIGKWEES